MKKVKLILKVVSFLLAIVIVAEILPFSTIATELSNQEIIEQAIAESIVDNSSAIVAEVETLRDEYTKHFRCEDGSFVAAMYNEPVHYQENGEWKEIDNTFQIKDNINVEKIAVTNDTKYAITKTSTPITFPESINDGKITILKNNNIITFGVKDNSTATVSVASLSTSDELISTSITKVIEDETAQSVNKNQKALLSDNRSSAITYNNVFKNASVEYEVSSSMIKESIVVSEKSDNYRYEFSIDFGKFIPVEEDDGSISIYENAQAKYPVMAIAPPYMFDADNEKSNNVTMDLIKNTNDYTLVVEADAKWINSLFRSFPVVIDPTFILDVGRSNIHDIHVNQDNPNWSYKHDYQLEVGRNGDNVFRTYIKYNLPVLPDCSVVTNAELELIQNWPRSFDTTELYLNVYQCNNDWNFDTITWNTQPIQDLSSATIVDYTNYQGGMSSEYNLNITKIVKDWYENGENYGLMLASSDESVEEKTSFYSSRNILSNYPIVTISYINNTGIEDYWTYEGFSLGDSGSAYVNTYNGALTYVHGDTSTSGLIAPISVSHVYTTDERNANGSINNMKFGKGFKLSAVEKIEATGSGLIEQNYPYKYIDADGTVHFFRQSSVSNQYYYEFGSDIILTSTSSGFVMSSPDGSKKEFDSSGYLTKTTDNNGNSSTITYSNGKITQITDGAGMSVDLSYNSDNTLNYVSDAAGRKTYYYYTSDGFLDHITYPDGTQTSYEYDNDNHLLNKIIAFDGSQATLTYKSVVCPGKTFYRVSSFSTYGEDTNHTLYDTITFEYRTNDTVLKSIEKGDEVIFAFDNSGRVVNAIQNGESVSVAEYHNSGNTKNKAKYASNVFTPKENLEKRTTGSYRHKTTTNNPNYYDYIDSTERILNQTKSVKLAIEPKAGAQSNYLYTGLRSNTGFSTYTVSAYVNIVDTMVAGSVYLTVVTTDEDDAVIREYKSEELTTTNNGWKRLFVTIDVPEEVYNITVSYGIFNGIGTVYLEDVYAEGSNVANSQMNLAKNSSFETVSGLWPPSFWGGTGSTMAMHGYTENPVNGSDAVWLLGNPNEQAYFSQKIFMNGKQGDVLVFGASAQALCSASSNNGKRFFGLKIQFLSGSTLLQEERFCFDKDVYGTMQTIMNRVVAEQDYNTVEIYLCYDYEINSVIFDDVFLYRDSFGTQYTYDTQGRITSAYDDNGQVVNCDYNGVDVSNVTSTSNGMVTQSASYTYDNKHNLLSAVGLDGVKTTYSYPETGNKGLPLSVTVSDESGQNTSTTTYEYYDNYNYLRSVTEPTGATTQYEYDTAKGLLTEVIDPNGNVTEYEYDPDNDLLLSVSNPSATLDNPTTEFEYDSGKRPMQIYNNELGYYMFYDNFGRLEVAETSRTSCFRINEYDNDGNLTMQYYGLENIGEFCYDEDGRLTSETYDGVLAYEYAYADDGSLGRVVDHESGVTWNYQYDLMGRVTSVNSSDSRQFAYTYNDKNQVSRFKVSQTDTDMLETVYAYDSSGRVTGAQVVSMDGQPQQSYAYDTLGRTQSFSSIYDSENAGNTVSYNYSYKVNNGNQTGLIDTVSYNKTASGASVSLLPQLKYNYDANGNITHLFENDILTVRYHYDGLNRLVREDNAQIGKTVVYNYDKEGDINSKVEYALTLADELGEHVDTINYEYKNFNWPNAVTKYDGGERIVYDYLGNPTSYRGYSMEWAKSRQLASMSDDQQTLSFKYDNNGIRTKKTVNGVDTEFTYVGDMLVSQKTGNEIINFSYTAGGAPYGFTYNGTSYFYLLNIQGDIIGIYNSNGDVVVEYTYDSWGKLISITGSLADTIGVKNPLRYRGYYYDTETSLYYLQSRYYDPETCRFINADAYFVAGNDYIQGTNMFAYCYNNPVMYVDTNGRETEEIINSSTQLAIDITTFLVGVYLFEEICKDFGIDGIGKLEGVLGNIEDMEYEIYEFNVSDIGETLTGLPADVTVSAAVDIIMYSFFSSIELFPVSAILVSTALSTILGSLLGEVNLKSGDYNLIHFSFLEVREGWPIGDWFVHDFYFLYFRSDEKTPIGKPIDEDFTAYNYWYSFMEM